MNAYQIAKTRFGNIRHTAIGPKDGDVILFVTGGGASFHSVHAFAWLARAGFRVIAINRPGYFDLPVDVVDSIEGHADIYRAVLQQIGIEGAVHVFGVSMGGLSALYYAQKYPTRSLVLWSAVTGPYVVQQEAATSGLGKLVLSKSGKKLVSWLLHLSAKYFPQQTIRTFLKTEAILTPAESKAIGRQVVENPASKREFRIFIESMLPMDALYTGMMDEVEKATRLSEPDWSDIMRPIYAVHSTLDQDFTIDH
ncbi:MAG: alpha/beta hydrolase, partial [Leptolyngbya sp. SIO3F4]|nr:alpha/beta hydrolase [Leptolyngbya sp. SIO3F4]